MNINWESPALIFGLLLIFLLLLQLLAKLFRKDWISGPLLKLMAATLYGGFYWFYLREDVHPNFAIIALLPGIFFVLLALGELLLTLVYKVSGLDKKIEENPAAPLGVKENSPTVLLDRFSFRK